jgi:Protein of unknown function (DUF3592)
VNDSKRLWGAIAGVIAAVALLIRIGGIAVRDLAGSEKLDAKLAHCKTGRYGPGPCVRGPLVDVIASSVISLILLLIILGCLLVIWRVRWERHLRGHGTRVPGVVVSSTRLTPANRRQPARVRVRVEVPGIPGVTALKQTDKVVPDGDHLTVAYDPARPRRRAIVVDDPAS